MYDTPNTALAAAERLAISQQSFRQLSPARWESVYVSILKRFTKAGRSNKHRCWLWEDFIEPHAVFGPSTELLDELPKSLGGPDVPAYLLLEAGAEKSRSAHWVFEGKLGSIVAVMAELPHCEFYVVDRSMDWLVANNHHDMWIGVGEHAINGLRSVDVA